MGKFVELNIGEIENVVGGVIVTASANRYPAPTDMDLPMNRFPTGGMSMNPPPAPAPRPPRPFPLG